MTSSSWSFLGYAFLLHGVTAGAWVVRGLKYGRVGDPGRFGWSYSEFSIISAASSGQSLLLILFFTTNQTVECSQKKKKTDGTFEEILPDATAGIKLFRSKHLCVKFIGATSPLRGLCYCAYLIDSGCLEMKLYRKVFF